MELGSVREWLSSVQNSRSNGLEGCALLFISLDILALGRSIPASSSTALLTAISGFWKQKQVRTNNPLRTRELKFTLLDCCPLVQLFPWIRPLSWSAVTHARYIALNALFSVI